MKTNDVVSGALAGGFAIFVFVHAQSFPPVPGLSIGPRLFPQAIAIGILICAVMLIYGGMMATATGRDASDAVKRPFWLTDPRKALGFAMIPAGLAIYVAVSERLGFIPTAFLLLLMLFVTFRVQFRRALLIAVIGSLGIHFVFYKLLKVPLPWGVFEAFAW